MNFKISKSTGIFALILLSQTITITTAQAASTDFFNHDTYTTDSLSGLDWLDVTASVYRSYNDVSSQFEAGGDFEGWRYATGEEFNALATNYTGNPISSTETGVIYHHNDKIDGLVSLLGSTLDSAYLKNAGVTYDEFNGYTEGSGQDYTFGLLADNLLSNNGHYLAVLWDDDSSNYFDYSHQLHNFLGDNSRQDHSGSYLVRDTVQLTATPLPASVWLMISGVLGVVGLSRKNKTQLNA